MNGDCHTSIDGFGFSPERIADAVDRKGLLSMEIEFSLACNFKCPYCYNHYDTVQEQLSPEEIDDVISQAQKLGAEKIIILGGEPMIYPSIHERIRVMYDRGLAVEMFTNGSHMTVENARFMFEHDVAVVLKLNSRDRNLQNKMAGRDDAYDIIRSALRNLKKAGYPAPGKRLAASTVICEQNIGELPQIWRWLRKSNIEPYFEMITPQGRAAGDEGSKSKSEDNLADGGESTLDNLEWGKLDLKRQYSLFEQLARIDREEFGRKWDPQPPLVGNSCLRHCFSCLVDARGDVMPCVGVTVPLGNVKETSLKQILDESEVIDNLRNYRNRIKGPCGVCERSEVCYGCRGAAYQLTGDYLASDPLCWHNEFEDIEFLPADVRPYLPHRSPMLLVDKICRVGERKGCISASIEPGNPFLNDEGTLDEVAYVELIAQSVAALEGFPMSPDERARHHGVLLTVKKLEITGQTWVKERLFIHLEKLGKLGDFGAVAGEIFRNEKKIAAGELTFFQNGPNNKPKENASSL